MDIELSKEEGTILSSESPKAGDLGHNLPKDTARLFGS